MWVIKVASISACLRYTLIYNVGIAVQIVIIVHLDREKNRQYYHVPSQQSTSNRDERIVTYPNVYAGMRDRNRESMSGIRTRSIQNRKFYLDNLFRTYFIVFKRALNYNIVQS